MAIRLIFLDIDGTLTNSKKEITPKTLQALLQAEQQGVRLVLASGRPSKGLEKFSDLLQMEKYEGYFVCNNGSMIKDAKTQEVLFNQPMSVEETRSVLRHLKNFPEVRAMIEDGDYMLVENVYHNYITLNGKPFNCMDYEAHSNHFLLHEERDLSAYVDFPVNKILTFSDPEYLQAHHTEMAAPFKDTLSCMFTSAFYFEYTAKGIDKAKSIETVFTKLGYTPEEMIAFGDGQNDAGMLKYCGIGVAMGNAIDEVKAIADEVTLSNEEDGIAHTLMKYIPGLKVV